jgi:hypothetical protein
MLIVRGHIHEWIPFKKQSSEQGNVFYCIEIAYFHSVFSSRKMIPRLVTGLWLIKNSGVEEHPERTLQPGLNKVPVCQR